MALAKKSAGGTAENSAGRKRTKEEKSPPSALAPEGVMAFLGQEPRRNWLFFARFGHDSVTFLTVLGTILRISVGSG